jgi:transcriptional regulator with XRE-family HTH domain
MPPITRRAPTGPHGTLRLTRLRAIRERRLMTQAELASAAGVGLNTIGRLESGIDAPRPSTVKKLAAALNVPAEALMPPAEPELAAAMRPPTEVGS